MLLVNRPREDIVAKSLCFSRSVPITWREFLWPSDHRAIRHLAFRRHHFPVAAPQVCQTKTSIRSWLIPLRSPSFPGGSHQNKDGFRPLCWYRQTVVPTLVKQGAVCHILMLRKELMSYKIITEVNPYFYRTTRLGGEIRVPRIGEERGMQISCKNIKRRCEKSRFKCIYKMVGIRTFL